MYILEIEDVYICFHFLSDVEVMQPCRCKSYVLPRTQLTSNSIGQHVSFFKTSFGPCRWPASSGNAKLRKANSFASVRSSNTAPDMENGTPSVPGESVFMIVIVTRGHGCTDGSESVRHVPIVKIDCGLLRHRDCQHLV